MSDKKTSKFGLGLLFGSILGGLAAFFLSPNSGKENREVVLKKMRELMKDLEDLELDKKVKEIWGEASVEGKKIYKAARKELVVKLESVKDAWDELDKEKYVEMVEDVVQELKKETPKAADKLMRLKDSFVRDWNDVMSEKKSSKSKKAKS